MIVNRTLDTRMGIHVNTIYIFLSRYKGKNKEYIIILSKNWKYERCKLYLMRHPSIFNIHFKLIIAKGLPKVREGITKTINE